MLTLIMKRNLTNQDKKDIEECFIKFNREEIKFDDGIKFVVNKSIHAIPNPPQKEPLKVTYINNPSEEVQLEALRRSGIAIKYIENPSEYIKSIIDIIETSKRTVYVLHEPNKKPLFTIGCQYNITKEYFIRRIYEEDGGLDENPHRQEYLDILNRY